MFYKIVRGIAWFIFHLIYRIDIKGKENIPENEGALICPNHYHWADPVMAAISVKRQINFMAKYELFKMPILRQLVRGLGAFPIKRGEVDLNASKTTLRLLKDKQLVGIFPEGTRIKGGERGIMGKANPGVAVFSVKTRKPVIPVLITGGYHLFDKMQVTIGEPVELYNYKHGKLSSEDYQELSQIIMEKISGLKREEE